LALTALSWATIAWACVQQIERLDHAAGRGCEDCDDRCGAKRRQDRNRVSLADAFRAEEVFGGLDVTHQMFAGDDDRIFVERRVEMDERPGVRVVDVTARDQVDDTRAGLECLTQRILTRPFLGR
jgi:hypothetical protein